jgi:hypothetical protein
MLKIVAGTQNMSRDVRFLVLMAASMKLTIFWEVALCSHVEIDRRFNVTTRHYIPDDFKLREQGCDFLLSLARGLK